MRARLLSIVTLTLLGASALDCGGGGGGDDTTDEPMPTGVDCSFLDHPCAKAFATALNQGAACFGHGSLCPNDSSECGSCQDPPTCTTCTWPSDGTQVLFAEGALNNPWAFTITSSAGSECYHTTGDLFTTGTVTIQFPSQGTFTETLTQTGVTIGCPDGTSVSASAQSLDSCEIPPGLKGADGTICCGSPPECPQEI